MTPNPTPAPLPRSALLCLALLAALVLASPPIHAQQTTRTLSGTVTTISHEPLRGAVVQLENLSTQAIISYITDTSGHYEFKRIGGDTDYSVWATYRGRRSKTKSLDKFSTKTQPTINLIVRLH